MTYDDLLKRSIEELRIKTAAHQTGWRLGQEAHWKLNQESGVLTFIFEDGIFAESAAQIVGTFNDLDSTWMWAWHNAAVEPALARDAELVRDYGREHSIEALTQPTWTATQEDGWNMVALAVKLAGAQGAYRGPAGSTYVFISFGEVRLAKKP